MPVRAFGVVLAGGLARRLGGEDKALLDLGEGPLLSRTLATLRPRVTGVAVIGDPERHAGFGAPVHRDLRPGNGPLGGLDTALALANAPYVLLLSCDLPFVDGALLDALLAAPPEADAVVPVLRGREEPLCARYAVGLRDAVTAALDAGQRKMIELYVGLPAARLDVEALGLAPAEALLNINSPDDLARAREIAARRRGTAPS